MKDPKSEGQKQTGRPKKAPGERKFKRLIYLTDKEYEAAKRKAARYDLTFSELAMKSMLNQKVTVYTPAYKELIVEINRIGVNVNQIAHFWNEQAGNFSESEVLKTLNMIQKRLNEIKVKGTYKQEET